MARTKRWIEGVRKNGITIVTISSWKYFHDYLQEEFLDYKNYVFRGQSNESWELEPSLNRYLRNSGKKNFKQVTQDHLANFKFSLRGRTSSLKDIVNDEDELWSLGQHHGLSTPMLDFSFSPYVAAYFAFFETETDSKYRIIYALSQSAINTEFDKELNIYKPISDYNPRLINQSGLFVKFDTDSSIENLFANKYDLNETKGKLFKIRIPNKDRHLCLRLLNRMNINHNTLFSDLTGASIFCNTELEIKNY